MLTTKKSEQHFLHSTVRQGDCLIWTGTDVGNGYGCMYVNGKMRLAHRYAWERENGHIQDGLVVNHTCWNRKCVNIEHLELATYSQNGSYRNGAAKGNKTGIRNVYPSGSGTYRVLVCLNGKQTYIGAYKTIEEAAKAAADARTNTFGEFAGR